MAQKTSIPKGTRDFGTKEMAERNYIFNTIREVYNKYGFEQIETPAMENLSTLLGKYGDEGDKLLFRILNSGEPFSKYNLADYQSNQPELVKNVCEKGLRYDLTVPFARYVVQHQNDITFPFKRFQIQTVWRADRPQKGRYREFYQCDADVVGSTSLLNELELVQIIDDVFNRLQINVSIHINNRKLLTGFAQIAGCPDKVIDLTVAIDKLEKIGLDAVKEELVQKGFSDTSLSVIEDILSINGESSNVLEKIEDLFKGNSSSKIVSEQGLVGVNELRELMSYIDLSKIKQEVVIDLSLARGLNYYTGAIFEVKAKDFQIGSICGGGRYDNLTGIFGLPNVSGVGISFGADRIYDVLKGLDKFPKSSLCGTQLLFANMDKNSLPYIINICKILRNSGISCELYPETTKLKKQFDYADKKSIPFISIIGETEVKDNCINIKKLDTGVQQSFHLDKIDEVIKFIKG